MLYEVITQVLAEIAARDGLPFTVLRPPLIYGPGVGANFLSLMRLCNSGLPLPFGGIIVANTAPGCWGPMLTPAIRGGHEVTLPVRVEGAEPGDSIAIRIRNNFV